MQILEKFMATALNKRRAIGCARGPARCRRGAAIIETAIGFSVLVVLVFGVIESALFFQDHEVLSNITREAARRMSVGDTVATAESKALQWNMGNSQFTGASVYFDIRQGTDASLGSWNTKPMVAGDRAKAKYWVRVQTTYTHKGVTGMFGFNQDLHATTILLVENGS